MFTPSPEPSASYLPLSSKDQNAYVSVETKAEPCRIAGNNLLSTRCPRQLR